jgi:hypothetical protein
VRPPEFSSRRRHGYILAERIHVRISTIITIGPNLTGLRGTQLTGSISCTLVTGRTSAKWSSRKAQPYSYGYGAQYDELFHHAIVIMDAGA